VITSKVPNVTMFTGTALWEHEFRPSGSFCCRNKPYLIKVGASPLQNALSPSFFQLCTNVETVTPPPWKNRLLDREAEVVWIRVFTRSNGNVVIHPATPATPPARSRAGQGTVCKSDSILWIRSTLECGYTGWEKYLQVASY